MFGSAVPKTLLLSISALLTLLVPCTTPEPLSLDSTPPAATLAPFELTAPPAKGASAGHDDGFGSTVALNGNLLLVGAPTAWTKDGPRGLVYLYDLKSQRLLRTFSIPRGLATRFFGREVFWSGDRVVIRARRRTDGPVYQTPLYAGTGMEIEDILYVFDAKTGRMISEFGGYNNEKGPHIYSLAVSGDNLLVGKAWEDNGARRSGGFYIYDLPTGKLLHKVLPPELEAEGYFGQGVAVTDGRALVGAGYGSEDPAKSAIGKAYLIDIATGQIVRSYNNPDQSGGHTEFGLRNAAHGGVALMGRSSGRTRASADTAVIALSDGALLHRFINRTQEDFMLSPELAINSRSAFVAVYSTHGFSTGGEGDLLEKEFAGRELSIYDIQSGELRQRLTPERPELLFHDFGNALAASDDWLAVGMQGRDLSNIKLQPYASYPQNGRVLVFARPSERTDWGW